MFSCTYYLSVFIVTVGASAQFYSYGIVNQEQTLVINWINQTYITRSALYFNSGQLNMVWSFVVSSVPIGAAVGSLLTRPLADNFGRRNSLVYNGILNVLAALAVYFSKYLTSPEMLFAGRFAFGINIGLASSLVPMYLAEITPQPNRSSIGTMHQVAVAFSEFASLLVGLLDFLEWPFVFGLPGFLALFLCLTLPFCTESPKYLLITCGEKQRAKETLFRLVDTHNANEMFNELLAEAQNSDEKPTTYHELFKRNDLRLPLAISLGMMFAQQFSGCAAVFAYSTDMFLNAQLKVEQAKIGTLGIGFVYFLSTCTSPIIIQRVTRRFLAVFQLASVACALTTLSVFTWYQNNSQSNWAGYGVIASLVFYMGVYGVASSIPWLITSELFDTKARSTAVSVSVCVAWTLCFLVSTLYLPFQQLVGVSFSYIPFIVMSALFAIIMYRLLPDSKMITSKTTTQRRVKRNRNDSWVSNISVI